MHVLHIDILCILCTLCTLCTLCILCIATYFYLFWASLHASKIRQDMVFIRPPGISEGVFQATFSWGWIISGSASCCYCLKSVQWPTLECRSTSVPLFLCWKSTTKDHINQPYSAYFAYFAYFAWSCLSLCRMGVNVSICHRLRAQWTISSLVCHSSFLHTGTASTCSSGADRNDSLLKCKESQRTFPGLPAIKPRTALTVVGTSTAGRWDEEPAIKAMKEK